MTVFLWLMSVLIAYFMGAFTGRAAERGERRMGDATNKEPVK